MKGDNQIAGTEALNRITSEEKAFFENTKWLTSEEAASYLRLPSVGMIRYLVAEKKITFYKLGRSLRFKCCDLDALLESTKVLRRIY